MSRFEKLRSSILFRLHAVAEDSNYVQNALLNGLMTAMCSSRTAISNTCKSVCMLVPAAEAVGASGVGVLQWRLPLMTLWMMPAQLLSAAWAGEVGGAASNRRAGGLLPRWHQPLQLSTVSTVKLCLLRCRTGWIHRCCFDVEGHQLFLSQDKPGMSYARVCII